MRAKKAEQLLETQVMNGRIAQNEAEEALAREEEARC